MSTPFALKKNLFIPMQQCGCFSSCRTVLLAYFCALVYALLFFRSANRTEQIKHSLVTGQSLLSSRKLWTTDLHAAPIGCQLKLLETINVNVVAKVDFSNCVFFRNSDGRDLCAATRGLKVLNYDEWRGFSLDPSPGALRRKFFDAYKNDEEFGQVDYVICSHPAANCELYLAFNKSMIIYNTQRIEFGRDDEFVWWRQPFLGNRTARWNHWVSNLRRMSQNPMHLIAANNRYDVNHMRYHTGVKAKYIPSWCGGALEEVTNGSYNPQRSQLVLTPYRLNLEFSPQSIPQIGWPLARDIDPMYHPLLDELNALRSEQFDVISMSSAFPGGKFESFSSFGNFKAAVVIPYQASTMFFFQLYRSSTPILAPSSKLLMAWVKSYRILWEVSYGNPPRSPDAHEFASFPNPNKFDAGSRQAWVQFYDIYQSDIFPHILYFDSWSDALRIAQTTDFAKVADSMRQHNIQEFHRIRKIWVKEFAELDRARRVSAGDSDYDTNLALHGFESLSYVERELHGDLHVRSDLAEDV